MKARLISHCVDNLQGQLSHLSQQGHLSMAKARKSEDESLDPSIGFIKKKG